VIKGEYKKILLEIFDVLGYFEHEKEMALGGFKKKFSNEMLKELHGILSEDQKQWLTQMIAIKEYDKNDPNFIGIQKTIDLTYSPEKLYELSRPVFKKIVGSYISFVSPKIDQEKAKKLEQILKDF